MLGVQFKNKGNVDIKLLAQTQKAVKSFCRASVGYRRETLNPPWFTVFGSSFSLQLK